MSTSLGSGGDGEVCLLFCEGPVEEPGYNGQVPTFVVGGCGRM